MQGFSKDNLSVGNHTITVTVTDSLGQTNSNSISIIIVAPIVLTAKITSPVADIYGFNMFKKGDSINFNSLVTGGTTPYIFSWTSDKDGIIGTVQNFTKNNLTTGHHIVTLTVNDAVGATVTQTTTLDVIECISMVYNGSPSDKLDITFIGNEYNVTTVNNFRNDVNTHINAIISTTPFSANTSKINFNRIEDFTIQHAAPYLLCTLAAEQYAQKAGAVCSSDLVIILWEGSGAVGCYRNDYKQIALLSGGSYILPHEIGHFFGLQDEYLIGPSVDWGPNCDKDPLCPKWTGMPGTGCFSGCSDLSFYRPTDNSKMKDPSQLFGAFNEPYIQNIFNTSYN